MKKMRKMLVSMTVTFATLASCFTTPVFAENITEHTNDVYESNYTVILEEYNKHQIGDIVTFDDGMQSVIWSREILVDEDDPNDYYIYTQYVEYVPDVEINFYSDNILDSVAPSESKITVYYSASKEHKYLDVTAEGGQRNITATISTKFKYDGKTYPSAYAEKYSFSDDDKFEFENYEPSTNFITKSCTNTLNYHLTFGSQKDKTKTVSVTCKKDGTQK